MSLKSKYILSFLGCLVGLYLLTFLVFPRALSGLRSKNVTTLYDGWTMVLTATDPVSVIAYSTDSISGARLFDEAGNEVLQTEREMTPGNFAVKGILPAGTYTLQGDPTTFEFNGEGFASLENPMSDKGDLWTGWFVWSVWTFLILIYHIFEYRRSKQQTE